MIIRLELLSQIRSSAIAEKPRVALYHAGNVRIYDFAEGQLASHYKYKHCKSSHKILLITSSN